MPFCKNCGTLMDEGVKFCPNCGIPVNGTAQSHGAYVNSKDTTASFDPADVTANKYLSIFCYLGVVCMLIPLIIRPNSDFIKYHANQGLVLFLFQIALAIVCIIPILGWIVAAIGYIFILVCIVIGIVHSCQGKAVELPIIGGIKIIG